MLKEGRLAGGKVFLGFAAIPLAFTLCVTSARGDDDGNDSACDIMIAYSRMGADHARLVPLAPSCQNSDRCTSTREVMITAGRTDVDMLNCDHAPPPDPRKIAAKQASDSCYSLMGAGERLASVLNPDPLAPPRVTRLEDIQQEIARLVALCNTSPNPPDPCIALAVFNVHKLPNPGLICTIKNFDDRYR